MRQSWSSGGLGGQAVKLGMSCVRVLEFMPSLPWRGVSEIIGSCQHFSFNIPPTPSQFTSPLPPSSTPSLSPAHLRCAAAAASLVRKQATKLPKTASGGLRHTVSVSARFEHCLQPLTPLLVSILAPTAPSPSLLRHSGSLVVFCCL
ncbi:hypothetical protein RJT34_08395 [Clitoria ternatea]|uniref:Uncharacterized protein n=1 Tax=Clitoria ternatea TaxID=43366 RepID=A0AAN9PU27_CLITE